MADARSVFRWGTVGKGAGAGVATAYHGGLGGMSGENTMVIGVVNPERT